MNPTSEIKCPHCGGAINPAALLGAMTSPAKRRFAASGCSAALASVLRERERQEAKWGEQNHVAEKWLVILGEEYGEACEATLEMEWNDYRAEMVQVAAVALAAVEACDRALGVPPNNKVSDGSEPFAAPLG